MTVDETYRNQLRELNELNWERFRSELRAEGIAIRADVEKRLAEIKKELDTRFAGMDARFERLEANFPTLEQKIDAKFARCETRMYKAMFAFWTATIIPLGALILALDGVFQR